MRYCQRLPLTWFTREPLSSGNPFIIVHHARRDPCAQNRPVGRGSGSSPTLARPFDANVSCILGPEMPLMFASKRTRVSRRP